MPVIKSAKKRMRQNTKRRARNFPIRNEMKTLFKNALQMIKDGKLEEVQKYLPSVYSIIDTACKKNIIHKNNAARKKSRLACALNELEKGGGKVAAVSEKKKVEEKVAEPVEKPDEKKEE